MIAQWTPISVRWLDASTDYGDAHSRDYTTWHRAERVTIGWLIFRDRDRIVVAMDDDRGCVKSETNVQTVTTIPSSYILDIIEYRAIAKPRTRKKPK